MGLEDFFGGRGGREWTPFHQHPAGRAQDYSSSIKRASQGALMPFSGEILDSRGSLGGIKDPKELRALRAQPPITNQNARAHALKRKLPFVRDSNASNASNAR